MKNIVIGCFILITIYGCGRFANKEGNTENKERIVCLSKQYNEIIFALHAEKNLVAVDLSSTYPPEIKKLVTVGYHRALSAEAIIAANPTLIIHDNNIGPEHVTRQLEELKIPMKVFNSKGDDLEGAKALFREMGDYFNRKNEADSLCEKLDHDMQLALKNSSSYSDTPSVVIIHFGRASNIYLTMTNKGTAAKMVSWAGGVIPVEGTKGMTQISPEIIAKADPDVILLTDFGYDRLGSLEKIKELPGVAGTKAARTNAIFRVEEHDMVYIGPRTGENVLKLQTLLHDRKQ